MSEPGALDQLLQSIVEEGLLSEVTLRESLAAAASKPETVQQLADQLLAEGKLTEFQVGFLKKGELKKLILGNYALLDRLGAGGMGEVFRAKHRRMGRLVALKVMSATSLFGPQAAERFDREVRAAARLSHPNIVQAYDSDEADGRLFLAMEYLEGADLDSCLRTRGVFSPTEAVEIIRQAARGLEYAHQQGVVHRDIKPSNLLLTSDGIVKVMDLGLARLDEPRDSGYQSTAPDVVFGTPDFMAPEQCLGAKYADHRSDIYSLGCTWYMLVRGQPIYGGENKVQKILAHREGEIPSLIPRGATPEMDAVFRKMAAKWPEHRQQSVSELLADLDDVIDPSQPISLSGLARFTAIDAAAPTVKRLGGLTPSSPRPPGAVGVAETDHPPAALPAAWLRPRSVEPLAPKTPPLGRTPQPATPEFEKPRIVPAAPPKPPRSKRNRVMIALAGLAIVVLAGITVQRLLGPRLGPAYDMLAHFDDTTLVSGWTFVGGALESDVAFRPRREFPSQAAALQPLGPFPVGDLEMELTVEHLGGIGPLIVGLPSHTGFAVFVCDVEALGPPPDGEFPPDEKGGRKGPEFEPKKGPEREFEGKGPEFDGKKGPPKGGLPQGGPPGAEGVEPPPRRPPDVPLEGPTSIHVVLRDGGTVLDCNGRSIAQLPWDPMNSVVHRAKTPEIFLAALGRYRVSHIVVRKIVPHGAILPGWAHFDRSEALAREESSAP